MYIIKPDLETEGNQTSDWKSNKGFYPDFKHKVGQEQTRKLEFERSCIWDWTTSKKATMFGN